LGFAVLLAAGGLVKAAGGSTAVAIAFAAVGVIGALAALTLGVLQQRAEGREERDTLWVKPPAKVGELTAGEGIYVLGVETEAPEALDAADLHGHEHAPYVPREVDRPLRERLRVAATLDAVTLIVLYGPSKSGKSRTLLEAVQETVSDAWLIGARDAGALARLARGRPPPEIAAGACVIWLDDIERFVVGPGGDGLDADTLEAFERWRRPVLVLATAGGKGRQLAGAEAERFAEPITDMLRAHRPLELTPWLSPDERRGLGSLDTYSPEAAERIGEEGVGEFMIAASKLRERLAAGVSCPEGLAVTQAAVDWRRVGLIRPIPGDALRTLYVNYLPGPSSATRLERGLEWATAPLYSQVALLQGRDAYEPYDYIVRYEQQRGRPVPVETWDAILDTYADKGELLNIGVTAWAAADWQHSERAFRRGDEHGDARAAFNIGVLLAQREDVEGAEAAWRRADEGGVAAAAYNLGVRLQKCGDLEGAEAAYRRAEKRGDISAANNLGDVLSRRGDLEGAEAAYLRGDEAGLAAAAYNLGMLLAQRGDLKGAEEAYLRGDDRGSADAAFNLGVLLAQRGDLEAAEAAYARGDERSDARSANNLGELLRRRGDLDGAEAAWRRADERGDAHAPHNLGVLLADRDDLEGAEVAWRRADERGDARAAHYLGMLFSERGDVERAEAMWRRALERARAEGDEEVAKAATTALGGLRS
jgi:tetratricopeptide (TPR) repeat protein